MGAPMALRLLETGFPLTVWNRTIEKTETLTESGASIAANAAEVSANAEIVLSMLGDDDAAREVFNGPDGLLSVPVRNKLFIEMGTLQPQTAKDLESLCQKCGAGFIDAPVSGTVGPAKEGRLMALVGGSEADRKACT